VDMLLHNSPWVIQGHDRWLRNASVLVVGDTIAEVGPSTDMAARHPHVEQVDCSGEILMPGFVNGHNHVYEILCRGLGKDAGTEGWLRNTIYPTNRALTAEDFYHGALLGAADCFRNGTTGLVSQLTNFARFHADAELRAFRTTGIRAQVARGASTASTIDPLENGAPDEEVAAIEAFLDEWSGHDRVTPAVGPSGLFSCDPDTHRRLKDLAKSRGAKYFTHLNETREQMELAHEHGYPGQIDWAYQLGILDRDTVVAHAVWSTQAEFELIAATGAQIVHNPVSNMVLSSGVPKVTDMLRAGVRVSLGTDGPASNDSHDMFAEMKAALLLQRVTTLDPQVIDPSAVLHMATEAGAPILGLEGRLGRLDPGQLADVVGVGIAGNPSMQPVFDPIAAVVYHGSGRDVSFTMIGGEFVYRDGEYPTIDVQQAIDLVQNESVPRVSRALGLEIVPR